MTAITLLYDSNLKESQLEFLQKIPISTVSLVLISSSSNLTVLNGGMIFLRRSWHPGLVLVPLFEESHQIEVEKLGASARDEEILSREAELARKNERLESAFNHLSRRLEESSEMKADIKILSRKKANRKERLPRVVELSSQGFHPSAIAEKFKLSDEQVALLLNFSAGRREERTIGA